MKKLKTYSFNTILRVIDKVITRRIQDKKELITE